MLGSYGGEASLNGGGVCLWRNVVIFPTEKTNSNYPCQTIVHPLKFQEVLESNIVIKGIVTVQLQ